MNWQRRIRCIQKKKKVLYTRNFLINLMVTTHKIPQTETHNFKKGGKKHGIPRNKINREKNKGKTLMEAQSY